MVNDTANLLLRHLRKLTAPARHAGPDHELLRRFSGQRDEGAFEELLRRHGAMVLGVCQRMLRHRQDAEDVFQATFLTLARKAASIRKREAVGCWLHGVARCLALQTRTAAARRRAHEGQIAERTSPDPLAEITLREAQGVLDEELARLPERLRAPLVLCHLEGATRDEAARQLGWSLATLKRRLEQGRELLRLRLARRGLAPSAALLAVLLAEKGTAGVPAALASATVNAALLFGTGQMPAAGTVSAQAAALAEGMAGAALLTKLKIGAALVLVLSVLAIGVGLAAHQAGAGGPEDEKEKGPKPAARLPDQAKPAEQPARIDGFGDPLPLAARARLGTVRLRHAGRVSRVALLADGKSVVSGGSEGTVRFWDAQTGKELHRLPGDSFAITLDGKTLATWYRNTTGRIRVWEVGTGREIQQFAAKNDAYCVAFSPDGKVLAAGGHDDDQILLLWDVATGKELPAPKMGPRFDYVYRLAFSQDGKTLITSGDDDNTIRFWDLATGKQLPPPGRNGRAFAPSPDGKLLALAGWGRQVSQGIIRFMELPTGKEVHQIEANCAGFGAVAFSPCGNLLAAGSNDGSIRLWETAAWKKVRSWSGHPDHITSLAFSADSKVLVSGSSDHTVQLWDVQTGKAIHPCTGHQGNVTSLAFPSDEKTLLSASGDHTIRLWDLATGREIRQLPGHQAPVVSLVLSPDRKLLVSNSWVHPNQDVSPRFWSMSTGKQLPRLPQVPPMARALAFSPDGKILALAEDLTVCLREVATGKELCRTEKSQSNICCAVFSPDGKSFAWSSCAYCFHLSDSATGKELRRFDTLVSGVRHATPWMAFSPDGQTLIVNLLEKICAWNPTGKDEPFHFSGLVPRRMITASLSRDGKTLATGQRDGTIYLWEAITGKIRAHFKAHEGSSTECNDHWNRGGVTSLAWSRAGKTLVSGGADTTILVWDVAALMGQARAQPVKLSPQELEMLWHDLAGDDARVAYRAIGRLIADPEEAVPFLSKQLQPVFPPNPNHLARLIADLDNDRFSIREAASQELERLGLLAKPALQQVLTGQPSVEVRSRVESLLEKLQARLLATELRSVRAIEVLEQVGTPEARQVLQHLAEGAPRARETREARAALQRLDRPSAKP